MFQFTTTRVINSNRYNNDVALYSSDATSFDVKGINTFLKENITAVYKNAYVEPANEKLMVDLSKVSAEEGDTLRLSIYIRLTQADNSSYYANDTQFKGRPFTVEFPWMADADATAKNLGDIIKKYGLLVFEKEILKVEVSGSSIVLSAVNEFQRFHTHKLEKFIESDKPFTEIWKEVKGATKILEEGVEGFGTYGYLLRNIKLPTHEHTRAFAPRADEMPIPGGKYHQYTLHYCVERGPLGLNAVGSTVKSVTTHVFYVLDSVVSDFETALLATVGKIIVAKTGEEISAPASAAETTEE